jgi:hypothetical protein
MAKILPNDWEKLYGHPVYLLETFIDPQRFKLWAQNSVGGL